MTDKFTTKVQNNTKSFLMFLSLTTLNSNSISIPESAVKKVWNEIKNVHCKRTSEEIEEVFHVFTQNY